MENLKVDEIFGKISERMKCEYGLTELGKHNVTKGTKREMILKGFLTQTLPSYLSVGCGEVFDSNGVVSKQQDIIIYDNRTFCYTPSNKEVPSYYPLDIVVGTCEVKTRLDKKSLTGAIENISSIKCLKIANEKNCRLTPRGSPRFRVYSTLFAFETDDVKTVKKNIQDIYKDLNTPKEEKIDLICVLDKWIALGEAKNQGFETDNKDDPLFLDTGKNSLLYALQIMLNGFPENPLQFDSFDYLDKLNLRDL